MVMCDDRSAEEIAAAEAASTWAVVRRVVVAAAIVALLLWAAGQPDGADAAPRPDAAREPGVLSHYGPTTESTGPVACGRGIIPAGVHGVAMRDQPCGTRIGMCLPDLSACVQARVIDYGPGILTRSHDALERTFSAIAPLSRGVVPIVWRVQPVKRCVPKWVKTYWRPAQGLAGRYAPTCGTRAAR